MHKTEVIHARMTPELKHSVEAVLRKVGLSTTEAISLFFHQIVLTEGLPFAVRVPNKATREAMLDVQNDINMTSHTSLADLRHSLEGTQPKRKATQSRENA